MAANIANTRLPGLCTVEINPTELCNRTCSFCPRADAEVYPNRKLQMSVETAEKIGADLADASFAGDIHVTGFGEPLLNPRLPEIVAALRQRLPGTLIEVITNGDRLNEKRIRTLLKAGVDHFIINCYDGEDQVKQRRALYESIGFDRYRFRQNFDEPGENAQSLIEKYGFTNRSGAAGPAPAAPIGRPCHLPFYKMFIDWNGDVLLCCNDWLRQHTGLGNIHESSISRIWRGEAFNAVRRQLAAGNRCGDACRNCDINGTAVGRDSVELFLKSETAPTG